MAKTADFDPEGEDILSGSTPLVGPFWKFFCSLRLTVVVLFLLAGGCVVGMFFDQTLTLEQHREVWASAIWKLWLFERLELNDVFHSWWFGFVVLMLALNLTACSIERLPKIWIDIRNPKRHLSEKQLRGIRHKYKVKVPAADVDRAMAAIRSLFPDSTYIHEDGAEKFAFKEKHKLARTGVYIVHIALLTIMFSSMWTTNFGIDGMLFIVEGSSNRFVSVRGPGGLSYKHDLGFDVGCTDFRLKTFIDGAPMDFESDLKVLNNGVLVAEKKIEVNDPLEYNGYTFYQASYNPIAGDQMVQLDVEKRGDAESRRIYTVSIGDRIEMADGTAFIPVEIIPEYAGLGAAVRVQKVLKDGTITTFVVFRSYPEFDAKVRRGPFIVGFRGFDQQYATGIQVGKVPAIEFVFLGFVMLFIGMYMAFFMSHRRYWARLKPLENGDFEFIVAGAARRHQYAFEEEFKKIREKLTTVFGKSDTERAKELAAQRRAERAAKKAAKEKSAD